MVTLMEQDAFIKRLVQLRMAKDVSAREMSLDIGQNENYINTIENGRTFPSMSSFFLICEYLGITPQQFFDVDIAEPSKINELTEAAKSLSGESMDLLISMAKKLKK